jgi:hypothetical protein
MNPMSKRIAPVVAVLSIAIGLILPPNASAATGTIMPSPYQTVLDTNGNPVSGACIWVTTAGTATPVNTYTDVGLTVANTNPIIANSAGRYTAFLTPGSSYKFVIESTPCSSISHGSTLVTADNIAATPVSAAAVDVVGTAGEAISAGNAVYLSDGSGSKVAGQWYKADTGNAYSSTAPRVGMAPSAIASGAAGTVRISGSVTGLSSLSVSATYYISTSGAITSTAPALRRVIGTADSATSIILGDIAVPTQAWVDDFRLTLTTAVPVTTADVTGASATTIFLSPYVGNRIDLPDSSGNPQRVTSAEISIAIPATTSQMYTVWGFLSGSTATLELLAWTNDTTPCATCTPVRTNGRLLKSGDSTRMYLGNVRTTAVSGQTEDSGFACTTTKRYLWNYYNRLKVPLCRLESTATWTYNVAAYRQAGAAVANQVDVIVGVAELPIELRVVASASNATAGTVMAVSIGEDSTTTPSTLAVQPQAQQQVANDAMPLASALVKYPAVGRHFYTWLEFVSVAAGATTFIGTTGTGLPQSGIVGTWER